MREVYLDNAATTFPKPRIVIDAIAQFMTEIGCSPGRGGYEKALQSGRIVLECRNMINNFFNGPGIDNVVFTQNITMSLNIALKGMIKENWHVITTSMEHNSVIRPLRSLEKYKNIKITVIECNKDGSLDPNQIKKAITKDTRVVVMTHASNLVGTIMPAEDVGKICREYGLYFVLDTAQSAGVIDIDFSNWNIDILAFTGHKGLLGPQGIGGFLISDRVNKITLPYIEGGTGSNSHIEFQPDMLPDKYESGTLNTPGIVGLKAGIEFINKVGIQNIRNHESKLMNMFINGLCSIDGIDIYGPKNSNKQTSTISINIKDMDPAEVSFILDNEYGIMTRTGMHCTPLGHRTIGTYPRGTVRFSMGYFNTEEEIEYTLRALKSISQQN